MEIRINKEIRDYTESIFLGLTLRQFLFSALGCLMAVVVYFSLSPTLGLEITSWLCILGALPFALLGFVSYQGMKAEEILIVAIKSWILSNRKLVFSPTCIYYEILKPQIQKNIKEAYKKNGKKLRSYKEERKRKT